MKTFDVPDYVKEETAVQEVQEQFQPQSIEQPIEISETAQETPAAADVKPSDNHVDEIVISDDITTEEAKPDDFTAKVLETINKDLGGEYKSLEDLKTEIVTLRNEKDRLSLVEEQQEKLFANEDIKRANEVAKSGGDFKEFLTLAETGKALSKQAEAIKTANNEDLVRAWLINSKQSEESIDRYFASKEDFEIDEKAEEIRNTELSHINGELEKIGNEKLSREQAAKNTITEFRDGVHAAFKSINLGGVKIEPTLLEKAKADILRGTDMNTIPRVDGKLQVGPYVENALKAKFFDKVVAMVRKNGVSQGTKAVFNELQNVGDTGGRIVPQGGAQEGSPIEALFGKVNY